MLSHFNSSSLVTVCVVLIDYGPFMMGRSIRYHRAYRITVDKWAAGLFICFLSVLKFLLFISHFRLPVRKKTKMFVGKCVNILWYLFLCMRVLLYPEITTPVPKLCLRGLWEGGSTGSMTGIFLVFSNHGNNILPYQDLCQWRWDGLQRHGRTGRWRE